MGCDRGAIHRLSQRLCNAGRIHRQDRAAQHEYPGRQRNRRRVVTNRRPPHNTIFNAPSTFNCRGEGAYADVFERQCESDSKTND